MLLFVDLLIHPWLNIGQVQRKMLMTGAGNIQQAHPSVAAPSVDVESAFYWNGLREHKLLLQKCGHCSRFRFPAMPSCPYCAARETTVVAASGNGAIYSWIVVHRAFDPAFYSDLPYTLASVDLEEGGRVVARLEGAQAQFGMPVHASYQDHTDWTELRFQPRGNI
jgi:uncharacterized OB-fold protein